MQVIRIDFAANYLADQHAGQKMLNAILAEYSSTSLKPIFREYRCLITMLSRALMPITDATADVPTNQGSTPFWLVPE